MVLFLALLMFTALPLGVILGRQGRVDWRGGALGIAALLVVLIALHLTSREPPPLAANWSPAGLLGDVAYWAFQISLWAASFGLGALLGNWCRGGGETRQFVTVIAGVLLVPATLLVWVLGSIGLNCSYSFGQIGHACY